MKIAFITTSVSSMVWAEYQYSFRPTLRPRRIHDLLSLREVPSLGHFRMNPKPATSNAASSWVSLDSSIPPFAFPEPVVAMNFPTLSKSRQTRFSPNHPDPSPIFSAEKLLMAGYFYNFGRRAQMESILKERSDADIGSRISSLRTIWELTV